MLLFRARWSDFEGSPLRRRPFRYGRRALLERLEDRSLLSIGVSPETALDESGGTRETEHSAVELFQTSPAHFIENVGQWDDSVRLMHPGQSANVWFTDEGPTLQLFQLQGEGEEQATSEQIVAARFDGGREVTPKGVNPLSAVINYYLGDSGQWVTNVPTYSTVLYEELYDNIDLSIWGKRSSLKYEFHVSPGADYSQIQVSYEGIEGLSIDADGSLVIDTSLGTLTDDAPYIYQEIDGRRSEVPGSFELVDADTYRFAVTGTYDPSHSLIIDPDLSWGSYLGGTALEAAERIAVDSENNVVLTGWTESADFRTHNPSDPSLAGGKDAFVSKVSSSGSLLWSTYLGGDRDDWGSDVATDGQNNILITGGTESDDFPSKNGFDQSREMDDAFVTKLNASGAIQWSSFLGGKGDDSPGGLAVDSAGDILVTGKSRFNTLGYDLLSTSEAFQRQPGGWQFLSGTADDDAFVTKISKDGAKLWFSYLGGTDKDTGTDIAVDSDGNVLVTGATSSSDFPHQSAFDTTFSGREAFVAKITGDGRQKLWASFLGGSGDEFGHSVACDSANNVLLTGWTYSSDFPDLRGFDSRLSGAMDAYVTKVASSGQLDWSSFLGGTGYEWGYDIASASNGDVLVAGVTWSSNFPVSGGFDTVYDRSEAYVTRVRSDGTGLVWSSYLGGSGVDNAFGVAVDSIGSVLVVGATTSDDLPFPDATPSVFQSSNAGGQDAFVAKIGYVAPPADYGDAPSTYPVRQEDNGARHAQGLACLGAYVDYESDGVPDALALSDDADATPDDEDGVEFLTALRPGQQGRLSIMVNADPNPGKTTYVAGWIDFDGNGVWDGGSENIFQRSYTTSGQREISFTVPSGTLPAETYARFRVSTDQASVAQPTGTALDGEVEDYRVAVDYGDAGNGYPTPWEANGASHFIVPEFYLGAGVDAEPNGQSSVNADSDDQSNMDDEDGVVLPTHLAIAEEAREIEVIVTASKAGYLNAWIDFDHDISTHPANEHVIQAKSVVAGENTIKVTIPKGLTKGPAFARFRFSSESNLSFDGFAKDGEVEDYKIELIEVKLEAVLAKFDTRYQEAPAPDAQGRVPIWTELAPKGVAIVNSIGKTSVGSATKTPGSFEVWYQLKTDPAEKPNWEPICKYSWTITTAKPVGWEPPDALYDQELEGWEASFKVDRPGLVDHYKIVFEFKAYDPYDENQELWTLATEHKLYGTYGTSLITNPKLEWVRKATSFASSEKAPLEILEALVHGIYDYGKRNHWRYATGGNKAGTEPGVTWKDLIEDKVATKSRWANCRTLATMWHTLAEVLGVEGTSVALIQGTKGNKAGYVTQTGNVTMQGYTGNAGPILTSTYDRWFFSSHRLGTYEDKAYDGVFGKVQNNGLYEGVQWDRTSDKSIPSDGYGKYWELTDGYRLYTAWSFFAEDAVPPGTNAYGYRKKPSASSLSETNTSSLSLTDDLAVAEALFSGTPAFQPIDDQGDGIYDSLAIDVDVQIDEPGQYIVYGELRQGEQLVSLQPSYDSGGQSFALIDATVAGGHPITLYFSGEEILQSGLDGVFTATLLLLGKDDFTPVEQQYESPAYVHTQFGELPARLTGVTDRGTDTDGDGKFDWLTVSAAIDALAPGEYRFDCLAYSADGNLITSEHHVENLPVGNSTVDVNLRGLDFSAWQTDGPYRLVVVATEGLDEQVGTVDQATAAYRYTDFDVSTETFTGPYVDHVVDSDGDGLFNLLTVDVGFHIGVVGDYTIEGWLCDASGETIESAAYTSSFAVGGHTAALDFHGTTINQSGSDGPYTLKYLSITPQGERPVTFVEQAAETAAYDADDFEVFEEPLIVLTTDYTDHLADIDGDGILDLVINTGVEVSQDGDIVLVASLVDSAGTEIETLETTAHLTADQTHFIPLSFPGNVIWAHGVDGPYEVFNVRVYHMDDPTHSKHQTYAHTTAPYGLAEFSGVPANADYGDAPSPGFPTSYESHGALHLLGSGLFLGATIDADSDGQSDATAIGDDTDGNDDDDGVTFAEEVVAGEYTRLTVTASQAGGYLNAWVDFNADGDWADENEHIFNDWALDAGTNTLGFNIPAAAVATNTFARFRLSTEEGLSYVGYAPDGEVEDYMVTITGGTGELDFGDAPFSTTLADNGARHLLQSDFFLGQGVDAEPDGQPNDDATGDDTEGSDDEDGVSFPLLLVPGQISQLVVELNDPQGVGGYLDAWIDFGADGSWVQEGDQIFGDWPLVAGTNTLDFTVPAGAIMGDTFARFRLSSTGSLSYEGLAPDGEVEDYLVTIEMVVNADLGDAPSLYPTLSEDDGARHVISPGFYLGSSIDADADGQPNSTATGDDQDGIDDEDGVAFTTSLVVGAPASVNVTASAGGGYLNGWIDFNADGDWTDAGEHVFKGVSLGSGVTSLPFTVLGSSKPGDTFARFRLSTSPNISYKGQAPDGEVEDYRINIQPSDAPIIDLGSVAYADITQLDVSLEDRVYRFETKNTGYLTLATLFSNPTDSAWVELYDADPLDNPSLYPFAVSELVGDGVEVLNASTLAEVVYYVLLTGTSSDVEFMLVNQLHHANDTVTVFGTDGADEFEFDASASRMVGINRMQYSFTDEQARTVIFDGGYGEDTAELTGSPNDDLAVLQPTSGSLKGPGFEVTMSGTTEITVHGAGGTADEARLYDSAGNDHYESAPGMTTLSGPGYSLTVEGFSINHAYGKTGGSDTAVIHGPEDSRIKFKADPEEEWSKLYSYSFFSRAKFFEVVNAYSHTDRDFARLFDSRDDDTLTCQLDETRMVSPKYDVTIHGFTQLIAYSYAGGFDTATLIDSPLDDEVRFRGHKTEMYDPKTNGDVFSLTVRAFDEVYAQALQGGYDRAKLHDTSRDDVFEASGATARMLTMESELELLYEAMAFEFVKAYGSDGTDRAEVDNAVDFALYFEGDWLQIRFRLDTFRTL